MLFTPSHQEAIERRLRESLAAGKPLGEALRELHGAGAVGLMWLCRAVQAVCGLPKQDAMKLVVRETFPDIGPQGRCVQSLPDG
jgi:hypothetical protein